MDDQKICSSQSIYLALPPVGDTESAPSNSPRAETQQGYEVVATGVFAHLLFPPLQVFNLT